MTSDDRNAQPQVGVLAVAWRDGQVLLVRRANPPQSGFWGFPGGHLDKEESLFDCAVRELEEETTVRARPEAVLAPVELIEPGEAHFILVPVPLSAVSGEARAASDALEAGWFRPDALPAPLCEKVEDVVLATAPAAGEAGR